METWSTAICMQAVDNMKTETVAKTDKKESSLTY